MRRRSVCRAVLCLFAATGALGASQDRRNRKPVVPTKDFVGRTVEGWNVRVDGRLLDARKDLGDRALKLLERHLYDIVRLVPERARVELQKVPIWVAIDEGTGAGAEYHPSRGWLKENGYNPDKAKAVEIGSCEKFLRHSVDQPFVMLHELAHAYHDQVLGFGHPRVREAYENARKGGTYESVLHIGGRKRRHYALTDHKEYFAESTEALFGTNDFYPFVRAELREHDPGMYDLLKELWQGPE